MGLLDKVKNMFTEEIDDVEPMEPEEPVKPVKKEVMQVEIESPRAKKEEEEKIFDLEREEAKPEKSLDAIDFGLEDTIDTPKRAPKKEKTAPIYFDDNDFKELEKPRFRPKKIRKEVYKPVIEKKAFKPTPIISPVYGVLDKNYQKDEVSNKGENRPSSYGRAMSIDEVRRKAYGNDIAEVTSTHYEVTGNTEVLDDLVGDVKDKLNEIPETQIADNLNNIENQLDNLEGTLVDIAKQSNSSDLNLGDDVNSNEGAVNESDLFDLIDSMYEKGND